MAFTTVSVATDDMERAVEEYAENASGSGDDNSTGNTNNNYIPNDPNDPRTNSTRKHIFSDRPRHLPYTPENEKILTDVGTNNDYYYGTDSRGNDWYVKFNDDGSQVWVEVRDNVIWDGGQSSDSRTWTDENGFKHGKNK